MDKKDKKKHNIYLINQDKVIKKLNLKEKELKQDLNDNKYKLSFLAQKIADSIIDNSKNKREEYYKQQKVNEDCLKLGYKIIFLFCEFSTQKPQLSKFCSSFIQASEQVVKYKTTYPSSIMFIWNDKSLFAVTTGSGYNEIESIYEPNFGLAFASCFKKNFRISSYKSTNLASNIRVQDITYRSLIDFINLNNLNVFFREIDGHFDDEELIKNFFGEEISFKHHIVKIFAKNNIKFNIALDYDRLISLINKVDQLDIEKYSDAFNLFKPLTKKQNEKEIEQLNERLISEIFSNYSNGKPIEFDIFDKDFENFRNANSYEIIYKDKIIYQIEDINDLEFIYKAYSDFCKLNKMDENIDSLKEFIFEAKIFSKGENYILIKRSIINHLSGEIVYSDKNYYVFFGQYYLQEKSYSELLTDSLSLKLGDDRFTQDININWKEGQNENYFNEKVSNDLKFVHLHKKIIQNIEFADLIKYNEEKNELIIVHVKDGFDNNMRQLERQIELSIKMIKDLRHNNQEDFMRKLYNCAQNKNIGYNITESFSSEDSFITTIKKCKYRYILAIRPKNQKLVESKSNIAKHCLNSIINTCNNESVDLKINLINY